MHKVKLLLGFLACLLAMLYAWHSLRSKSDFSKAQPGTPSVAETLPVSSAAVQGELPLEGMEWFYGRYGTDSDAYAGFNAATFSRREYDCLITEAQNDDDAALSALKFSILKHLEKRADDPRYKDLKDVLYSEDFLVSVNFPEISDVLPPFLFENNKQLSLAIVRKSPYSLQFLPVRVRADKDVVSAAALEEIGVLKYGEDSVLSDPEFVMDFLDKSTAPKALSYFPWRVTGNRELMLAVLKKHPEQFLAIAPELRDDPEILPILRSFVLNAPEEYHIPGKLVYDRDFAKKLLAKKPGELKYFSDSIKADREIVIPLLKAHPGVFSYASKDIQNDPQVLPHIAEFIYSNPAATIDYPDGLRNDKAFARRLLGKQGDTLAWFSKEIQNDKELVLIALKNQPYIFFAAGKEIQNDPAVLPLIREHILTAKALGAASLPEKLSDDREVVLKAVSLRGSVLESASERLKDDEEVVRAAIKNSPDSIKYASDRLRTKGTTDKVGYNEN